MTKKKYVEASAAWKEAGRSLGIPVIAPHQFQAEGASFWCVAFLPTFGGPKGMLIAGIEAPSYETDLALRSAAEKEGYYFSSVNVEVYRRFDEGVFVEALRDWGYYGEAANKPEWLVEPTAPCS